MVQGTYSSGSSTFSELIEEESARYIERPSVERAIREYLANHRHGCCVIKGKPGSGKTALAAALIRSDGYAHYFLRKGHTAFSLWSDPHAFLTSLGFQLLERFGKSIFPKSVGLDFHGRIRDVGPKGSVVGAEIDQLVTIPWHSADLNVDLQTQHIQGDAVGVRIRQIVEDYHRIPLMTYRQMAFINPLRRLRETDPEARLVIWVDGLDEISTVDAVDHSQLMRENVATLLPTERETADLGNVMLIISSRPGSHLNRFLDDAAYEIELEDEQFSDDTCQAAMKFIQREIIAGGVTKEIEQSDYTQEQVHQALADSGPYNFLFLRHFFDGIRSGEVGALMEGSIPSTLETIYERLLRQLVQRIGDDAYLYYYHPAVCLLAVANEGLTNRQIEQFTGLQLNRVNSVVKRLRPYLDLNRVESHKTYSFYHKSFRDCICSPEYSDEIWFVEPEKANQAIAEYYLPDGSLAFDTILDPYGFDYLTDHMARGGIQWQKRLRDLLGEPWRKLKREYYHSNWSFETDLEKASKSLAGCPFPEALVETARLLLMKTILQRLQVPVGALEVMARLGQTSRALDFIRPNLHPLKKIMCYGEILRGMAAREDTDEDLMYEIIHQGLQMISKDPDHQHLLYLLKECPVKEDARMRQVLSAATEIFNRAPQHFESARALSEIARQMTSMDVQAAEQYFEQSLNLTDNPYYIAEILRKWSDFDPEAAAEMLKTLELIPSHESLEAALYVISSLNRDSNGGIIEPYLSQATDEILPMITDLFERAMSLIAIARYASEAGDRNLAAESISEAIGAIDKIGGDQDPEANYQSRPGQKTSALIHAAEVEVHLSPETGRHTLQRAWEALDKNSFWDAGKTLDRLIQAQAVAGWEFLEACFERIKSRSTRTGLSIAAAKHLMNHDGETAKAYLEETLSLAENEEATMFGVKWERQDFDLHLAKALGIGGRDEARRILSESYNCYEMEWYSEIIRRMIESNHSGLAACVDEAVKEWSKTSPDLEFLALLKELPKDVIHGLLEVVENLDSKSHRLLMKGTFSALLAVDDLELSTRLLNEAIELMDGAFEGRNQITPYMALAFIAGQLWGFDQTTARELWLDGLLRLDAAFMDPEDFSTHQTHLMIMTEAVSLGAPDAALELLSASRVAPAPSNTLSFVVPGPTGAAAIQAGMEQRDYYLGIALAHASWLNPHGAANYHLPKIPSPGIRSIAASHLAILIDEDSKDERLQLCDIALSAANAVDIHPIRCVLQADAAWAYTEAGAKKTGLEAAVDIMTDILENGSYPESMERKPGYGNAYGNCLQIVAAAGDEFGALQFLWKAEALSSTCDIIFGYIPEILSRVEASALPDLYEAVLKAETLFE